MAYRFLYTLAQFGMSIKSLLRLIEDRAGHRTRDKCMTSLQARLKNGSFARALRTS